LPASPRIEEPLAANGMIGGFPGGLDWKRRLLEREGVTVA
jgi:hypothetical protein